MCQFIRQSLIFSIPLDIFVNSSYSPPMFFKRSYFLCLFPLLLISCGKTFNPAQDEVRGNVQVQILNSKDVSQLSADENPYEFQVIELLNIYDLSSLTGKFVQFYTKASNEGGKLDGTQPKAHFIKTKKGYFVPRNNFSMELASIYFHTQNLALLDQKIGAEKINSLPRKVIIDTPISQGTYKDNNAIYDASMDVIVYLPYTEENLSLALNGGIFAHEYFHSLFYKLVQKKLEKNKLFDQVSSLTAHTKTNSLNPKSFMTSDEFLEKLARFRKTSEFKITQEVVQDYYILLFKGLNEGLADFWGWSYTKDVNFIQHSLPEVNNKRCLDLKIQNLSSPVLFTKDELLSVIFYPFDSENDKIANINSYSYSVGTRFALFFKELTQTISQKRAITTDEAKILVMKSLVSFMTDFGNELGQTELKAEGKELISSQDLILKFANKFSFLHKEECQVALASYMSDMNNLNTFTCGSSDKEFKLTAIKKESTKNE